MNIGAILNEMRQQSQFCDVILTTDDQQDLPAHRNVLSAMSPYFRARFAAAANVAGGPGVERIKLHGIDTASLSALLDHLYTDTVPAISDANAQALLGAACLLQLPAVRAACVAHLVASLAPGTCLRIRRAADRNACAELLQQADDYIQLNAVALVLSPDFKRLMKVGQVSTLDASEVIVTIDEPAVDSRSITKPDEKIVRPEAAAVDRKPPTENKPDVVIVKKDAAAVELKLPTTNTGPSAEIVNQAAAVEHNRAADNTPDKEIVQEHAAGELPIVKEAVALAVKRMLPTLNEAVPAKRKPSGSGSLLLVDSIFTQRYDLARQSWGRVDAGLHNLVHLQPPSCIHGAFLYIFGSECDVDALDTNTGIWSKATHLRMSRTHQAVDVLNGTFYTVGGLTRLDGCKTSSVVMYDSALQQWTPSASMCESRSNHGVAVLNQHLYAVGGYPNNRSAECYTADSNKWHYIAPMSVGRCNMGMAVLDGKLYAVGGSTGFDKRPVKTVEVYDPATNMWNRLQGMAVERKWPATMVYAGELYVAGGTDDRLVEVYSPVTGLWRTLPALMPESMQAPVACWVK